MFCNNCGSQVPDGAAFCANCGAKTAVGAAPQPTVNKVSVKAAPVINSESVQPQPQPQPAPEQPQCGGYTPDPAVNGQQSFNQNFGAQNGYAQSFEKPDPPVVGVIPPYAPRAEEVKKRSKAPIIVLVILLVLVIAGGVFVAVYFLNTDKEVEEDKPSVTRQLKDANSNARTFYNCVAECVADNETMGISLGSTMSEISRYYDLSQLNASNSEFESMLAETAAGSNIDEGYIFVGTTNIDGYDTFFVQYWSDEYVGTPIGQYPEPIDKDYYEDVERGIYMPAQ